MKPASPKPEYLQELRPDLVSDLLPNRSTWDKHYTRKRAAQEYPDENLVRLLKSFPGQSALDLGCGSGRHIALLRDCGYSSIHATDVSETGLELCRKKYRYAVFHPLDIKMLKKDEFRLPLEDESLDAVVAWGVLHYNSETMIRNMLLEIRRILRSGGRFFGTLRSDRDTHFKNNPDMQGAEVRLFSREEVKDLLLEYFCDVSLGYSERIPMGSKYRVSHWIFSASN